MNILGKYELRDGLCRLALLAAIILAHLVIGEARGQDPAHAFSCRVGVEGKECNGRTCHLRTYWGSGTLIAPGRVLTCAHLWDEGKENEPVFVQFMGQRFPAKLIKFDRRPDLALLAVPDPIRVVTEGGNHPRSYTVKPSEWCNAFDDKAEFQVAGFGGGTYRRLAGRLTYWGAPVNGRHCFFLSIPSRNGDSGGGVFDSHGHLVGVRWGGDDRQSGGNEDFTCASSGEPLVNFLWGEE